MNKEKSSSALTDLESSVKMAEDDYFGGSSRRIEVVVYEDDPYNQDTGERKKREVCTMSFSLSHKYTWAEGLLESINAHLARERGEIKALDTLDGHLREKHKKN